MQKLNVKENYVKNLCEKFSLDYSKVANVNLQLSPTDNMYEKGKEGSDEHYFSVGLQALAIIDKARALVNKNEVSSLLDFGCGYGRVLRFLKAHFPETNITCSEVEPT